MRPDDLARVLRDCPGPTLVCVQAGNVNTGALRSRRRDRPPGARARGLASRRRRVRPLGRGEPQASAPGDGSGTGRLLGHGRPQVAERSLRLRHRHRGRSRRPPSGPHRPCFVSRADHRSRARSLRVGPRVLAPGARLHGLRRAPQPRATGRGRDDRAELRLGPAHGREAEPRARSPRPQRRGAQPGAGAVRASRRRRRGRLHPRGHCAGPERRNRVAGRVALAGPGGHAHLGLELVDHGGGRRSVRRCHPRGGQPPRPPSASPSPRLSKGNDHEHDGWNPPPEDGPRRDAEGRGHHGRHGRDPGADRRSRGGGGGHGPGAGPLRHPPRRRGRAHDRSRHHRAHHGSGLHPGDGQVPDRPFQRSAGAGGARGRLHRRERGPDSRRRPAPHRQARVQDSFRLRLPRPRRGPAAHRRRGRPPAHQGRSRNRRRGRSGAPHPGGDERRSGGSPLSAPRS